MSAASNERAWLGYALVLAAAVLWGLIGVLSKGILQAGVGPLEIAFWRATLAGGLFVVHAGARGRLHLEPRDPRGRLRDGAVFVGFGLLGVTVFYAALNLAIEAGGVSLAFILLYSAPAFVALLAWALLGEPLTRRKALLVALAVTGVVLVAGDSGHGVRVTPAALFWGLAAGFSYASYYIFGKRLLRRYAPVTIYALVLPVGALGLAPLVSFAPKTPTAWALLALMAVLSTYLAYLLYFTGLRRVEASRAVLVATVEPVVAAALAALWFGERFGWPGLLGGGLVLLAAAASALPPKRPAGSGVGPGRRRSGGEGRIRR